MVSQPQAETTKQAPDVVQSAPVKVDFATDLFDMLSMDDPGENGSAPASAGACATATADDNNWAGFQCMSYMIFFNSYHDFTEAAVAGHILVIIFVYDLVLSLLL